MDFTNIITTNHKRYIKNIVDIVKDNKFQVKAPKLDKGDILLWNSLIYMAPASQSKSNLWSSITFHVIKSSSNFQVFRNISRKLDYDRKFLFNIFRPKDLSKNRNKTIFFIEKNFPKIL